MRRAPVAAWPLVLVAACRFAPGGAPDDAIHVDDAPVVPGPDGARDGAPGPMVTFVHSTSGAGSPWNNGAPGYMMTLADNVAAGNVLAVYVTFDGRVNLSSITDSASNTYTVAQTINDSTNQQKAAVAYAHANASGADTITVSFDSDACCTAIIVHELHGANATTPLDGHAGQVQSSPGTGTDAVTSGTMTTHAAYEYIFAATSNSNNVGGLSIATGTGETQREALVPAGGNPTTSADRIAVAPTTAASTFTFSKNGVALTLEMAFRP